MNQPLKTTLDRLPDIGKYGLVLLTVVIISFLFPDNFRFQYEFELGQTWRYDDLYAPFDFTIKKSSDEIAAESQQVEAGFAPYYLARPEVVQLQKDRFLAEFKRQLAGVQDDPQFSDVVRNQQRYLQYGNDLLDRIYSRGVVSLDAQHADKGKEFVINIVRGNTTLKRTVQNLMNVEQAKDKIVDSLPYSRLYVAEFLLPILPEMVVPNVVYSDSITQKFRSEALGNIVTSKGLVQKDDLIIAKGARINPDTYQKLSSFRDQYLEESASSRSYLTVFIGYFLLTSIILGIFMIYLQFYAPELFQKFSRLIFILIWLIAYSYLVFLIERTETLSAYIIPFCIVPIVIKIFFSDRLAFFTHIVVILVASFITSLGYEFTVLQILVGIVAVMSNPDARDWSKFFKSMIYIFLTFSLGYVGLTLIQGGRLQIEDTYFFGWIFLSVFLTLLAYPLIPLLERVFGFTSSISLVELSDMNRPLLRELALKAPGTLQHSLQVANLSEAAATAIGADPLLVKVAALYHDIGKTLKPEYFIENQSGNNPHDAISHLESAKIIIEHVTEGERMAKKYRLPKVLIDFIRTHHGTTRVEYFYRNFVNENPNREFDETLFRYPGPKPSSKEETILMVADSLEAASKSLKNPTGQDIDELVDKIVGGKISHGQFDDSAMTFEELEICKTVFRKLLRSINHVRVEYPEEPK